MSPVHASSIVTLLHNKHVKDLGLEECKTGSTWFGAPARLDYWAMRRSWANFRTWGYEIKVSRQDFLRDEKWRDYLPFCHEFYFVAPPGVIAPNELPPEAGLLVTSVNAKKLYTKKKPGICREEIRQEILIYALMWRTRGMSRPERAEEWARWLEEEKSYHSIGRSVSKQMAELAAEARRVMTAEHHRHEREMDLYRDLEAWMKTEGLSIHHRPKESIRDRILGSAEMAGLQTRIHQLENAISALQARIDQEMAPARRKEG